MKTQDLKAGIEELENGINEDIKIFKMLGFSDKENIAYFDGVVCILKKWLADRQGMGKRLKDDKDVIDSLGEAVEESEKVLTMRIKSLEAEIKTLAKENGERAKAYAELKDGCPCQEMTAYEEILNDDESLIAELKAEIKRLKEYEGKTCLDCQKEHEKAMETFKKKGVDL